MPKPDITPEQYAEAVLTIARYQIQEVRRAIAEQPLDAPAEPTGEEFAEYVCGSLELADVIDDVKSAVPSEVEAGY